MEIFDLIIIALWILMSGFWLVTAYDINKYKPIEKWDFAPVVWCVASYIITILGIAKLIGLF